MGAQLAEFLGIWNVSQVTAVEGIENSRMRTRSQIERGYRVMETPLPALITVTHEINTPRFTSLFGVMEAESKPLQIWSAERDRDSAEEVGFPGSPTQTGDVFMPPMKRKAEMLAGDRRRWSRKSSTESARRLGKYA